MVFLYLQRNVFGNPLDASVVQLKFSFWKTIDWDNAVDSTGKRLIALVLLIALFGVGAQRLTENAPRLHRASPDLIGLNTSFTDEELDRAERELGVVL